ncbi:MAG: 4Fe-4S binding protein, partial [Desulfobacteraceae bacterium]
PKLVEVGRHVNIELITLAEIADVSGSEGDFKVRIRQKPRYVDMDKCIACGTCAEKCPKRVPDAYNEGLGKRKAIYVPYSQAVPLKYAIDPDQCIYLTKGKCRACEKFCPAGAINFDDREKEFDLEVGSVILAPGFVPFDPARSDVFGYNGLPDVVTSLEFERILSATGPFQGHLVRPSDAKGGSAPKKIAWLQCVGSRDPGSSGHSYCSSVCCMYAVKQAVMAKDHSKEPLDCAIFYMDMRTQGKDFDRYYEKARESGVRFIRNRIHTVEPVPGSNDLRLRYAGEDGELKEEVFDMVVLSTGLEIAPEVVGLAGRLGVDLDKDGFAGGDPFFPVATSRPGIYACGAFSGPKDIPQSVMEASAAACAATEKIAGARHTCTRVKETVEERDVSRERPKIGVFVCNCGVNIGGVVNVPEVAEYARRLPHVAYVEENLFTCSQDTQDKMAEVIRTQGLNRVVVAACTPRTHEALFQETLTSAGLNKYLVEMANIRNHDSWVHAGDPEAATQKAKDLVRMAVAKASLLDPLKETDLPVHRAALVVGGGPAGMSAALSLAAQGCPVHLVERSDHLGGHALNLYKTWDGGDVKSYLAELTEEVSGHRNITLHLGTNIRSAEGFVGNFRTELESEGGTEFVDHGVVILATGAVEARPDSYLYGKHPAVLTNTELDGLFIDDDRRLGGIQTAAFIQCVGSRDENRPYCSKVCCTHTLRNAVELKKRNPETSVYVFYRDIRAYGKRERLYQEARALGVLFFPYDPEAPPEVRENGDMVRIEFNDAVLGRRLGVNADLLVLASAVAARDNTELTRLFKVPVDGDGWLLEAHQKLRPVDFAGDGIFLCGMAHYPKPLDECTAQARAAAARALTYLTRDTITLSGVVTYIEPALCSGCGGCIEVCPYGAITLDQAQGIAVVNPALCKGCGACAAACPSEAPRLKGFDNRQLYAQIKSALTG